jgi:hypothetical protein
MSRSATQKKTDNCTPAPSLRDAKKAMDRSVRTGAKNIAPAAAIAGVTHYFADPVLAVGFFSEIGQKTITDDEKRRWRQQGEAILASIVTVPVTESATGIEIIVSIPIGQAGDAPERLVALGLKQTMRPSATRPYIEYRGRGDIAAVQAAIAPIGGIATVIRRPERSSTLGGVEAPDDDVDPVVVDLADPMTDNLAPVTHLEALETALEAAIRSGQADNPEPQPIKLSPNMPIERHETAHQSEASPEIRHHTISAAAKPTPDDKKTKANSRSADESPKPFVEADGVATSTAAQTLKPLPGLGSPMTRIVPPFLPRPNQGAMRRPT